MQKPYEAFQMLRRLGAGPKAVVPVSGTKGCEIRTTKEVGAVCGAASGAGGWKGECGVWVGVERSWNMKTKWE